MTVMPETVTIPTKTLMDAVAAAYAMEELLLVFIGPQDCPATETLRGITRRLLIAVAPHPSGYPDDLRPPQPDRHRGGCPEQGRVRGHA